MPVPTHDFESFPALGLNPFVSDKGVEMEKTGIFKLKNVSQCKLLIW